MTNLKRIVTLVMIGVLLVSISIPAFASETGASAGRVSNMTLSEVINYIESSGGVVDYDFANICADIIELKESGFSAEDILAQIDSRSTPYSLYDTWGILTDAEKALCVTHPKEALTIQSNSTKAKTSTEEVYGYNGNGDTSDAYRHGYWNALNARDVGSSVAESFATAHEDVSDEQLNYVDETGFSGWQHRSMDLHNNEVGRSVVDWNDWLTSDSTMSARILEQIEKGNMVILVK